MVGAYSARELSRGPSPLDRVVPASQVASIPERVAGDERSRVDARNQPAAQEPNAEAPSDEAFADEAKIAQAKNNEQETGADADPGLAARRKRDRAASPQPATSASLGRSIDPAEPPATLAEGSTAPAEAPPSLGKQSGTAGSVGQRTEAGEEEALDAKAEQDAFRANEPTSGAASGDDLNELQDSDREALTEEAAVETRMFSLSEGEAKLQAEAARAPSTEDELRRLLVELAPDRDETEVRDAVIELVEVYEANPSSGRDGAIDESRQIRVYKWSTVGGAKEKSLETAATLQDSVAIAVSLALDRLDDDELRARAERALGLDGSAGPPDQR